MKIPLNSALTFFSPRNMEWYMKIAIIFNEDLHGVINTFGMQNKEIYNPATVKRVAECLEAGGHNVAVIDGNMHVVERLQNFMPKVIEGEQMGMVFNMAYGIQGESRYTHIPSLLEMLGIPYVGSTPAGHALALDKVITKIIMQKHGISTPEFWVFNSADDIMDEVIYPVIVKPKMESVSFGLKVVYNEADLREAVHFVVTEFQQQALVEQFIRGREFCVGVLGNSPVEAFPVLEIDLESDPDAIQTVDDKKSAPRQKICPAQLDDELAQKMVDESVAAFKALQLRDFARVDIRMDEAGKIYLLEINSMASLGKTGSYVAAAAVAGYDYQALVNKMLDVAAVRYFSQSGTPSDELLQKRVPIPVRCRGFLRGRMSNYEKMLEKITNINSYVRNVEGVNRIGDVMRKELAALGFIQEVIPQIEVGNQLFFTNSLDGSYDVLLMGSLDNNRPLSQHRPFGKDVQRAYGTGVWEHKGGLVTLVAALQTLKFIRHLRKLRIGILLTTDDSLQGQFSKELVKKKSKNAHTVIGLHGGGLDGSFVTSRSGAAVYYCETTLVEGSGEQVAHLATQFHKLLGAYGGLSTDDERMIIAPSRVSFVSNVMYPHAHGEARISVRFNNTATIDEVHPKLMTTLPKKFLKSSTWQVDGGVRRPAMIESEKVRSFWEKVKERAAQLDIRVVKEHRWSSSDICFVDTEKHSVLDGFGPVGDKPHGEREYVVMHSLLERSLLLALTLLDESR